MFTYLKKTIYYHLKLIIYIAILALPAQAFAADVDWIGGDGNWSDGSNWSGGVVPSANDNITIDCSCTVTATANIEIDNKLTIAVGSTLDMGDEELKVGENNNDAELYNNGTIQNAKKVKNKGDGVLGEGPFLFNTGIITTKEFDIGNNNGGGVVENSLTGIINVTKDEAKAMHIDGTLCNAGVVNATNGVFFHGAKIDCGGTINAKRFDLEEGAGAGGAADGAACILCQNFSDGMDCMGNDSSTPVYVVDDESYTFAELLEELEKDEDCGVTTTSFPCIDPNDENDPLEDSDKFYSYYFEFDDDDDSDTPPVIAAGTSESNVVSVTLFEDTADEVTFDLHVSCSDEFFGPDEKVGTDDDGYGEKDGPQEEDGVKVTYYRIFKYEVDDDGDCELKKSCESSISTEPGTNECIDPKDENDPLIGDSNYYSYYFEFDDGSGGDPIVVAGVDESNVVSVTLFEDTDDEVTFDLHISCSDEFFGPDEEAGTEDDGYGEKDGPQEENGVRVSYYRIFKYERKDSGDCELKKSCESFITPGEGSSGECVDPRDENEPLAGNDDYYSYYFEFDDGSGGDPVVAAGVSDSNEVSVTLFEGTVDEVTFILHVSCSDEYFGPDEKAGTEDDGYGEKDGPQASDGVRVTYYRIYKYKRENNGDCELNKSCESSITPGDGSNECIDPDDENEPLAGNGNYYSYYFEFDNGETAEGVNESNVAEVTIMVDGEEETFDLHISCSDEFFGEDEEEGTEDDGYGEKDGPQEENGVKVTYYKIFKYERKDDGDCELKKSCEGGSEPPVVTSDGDDCEPCVEDADLRRDDLINENNVDGGWTITLSSVDQLENNNYKICVILCHDGCEGGDDNACAELSHFTVEVDDLDNLVGMPTIESTENGDWDYDAGALAGEPVGFGEGFKFEEPTATIGGGTAGSIKVCYELSALPADGENLIFSVKSNITHHTTFNGVDFKTVLEECDDDEDDDCKFCYEDEVCIDLDHVTSCDPNPASCEPPLPIELSSFEIEATEEGAVYVYWSTASEIDNDYFTIQKSQDGRKWLNVKVIEGSGESSVSKYYSSIDTKPFKGLSYYRLKQTDIGGNYSYSEIRSINIDGQGNNILFYPNPFVNKITIEGFEPEDKVFKVYNITGIDITDQVLVSKSTLSSLILDLSRLPSGIYTININNEYSKVYKK